MCFDAILPHYDLFRRQHNFSTDLVSRIHNQIAIRGGDSDQTEVSKSSTIKKTYFPALLVQWALQWRSIIMSSLGKTAYPYCVYLRSVDLGNLEDLFDEKVFKESMQSA